MVFIWSTNLGTMESFSDLVRHRTELLHPHTERCRRGVVECHLKQFQEYFFINLWFSLSSHTAEPSIKLSCNLKKIDCKLFLYFIQFLHKGSTLFSNFLSKVSYKQLSQKPFVLEPLNLAYIVGVAPKGPL